MVQKQKKQAWYPDAEMIYNNKHYIFKIILIQYLILCYCFALGVSSFELHDDFDDDVI